MNSEEYAITTFDNPYDPFEQFSQWFTFDVTHGYNTCAYLARVAHTSDQMSDSENNREISKAIDEIIKYDFLNIYKKVKRGSFHFNPDDVLLIRPDESESTAPTLS